MQVKKVFEYAVIRVVARVERGEFLNAGVIVFSKSDSYLGMKYAVCAEKLRVLYDEIDLDEIQCQLETFEKICLGDPSGGPIAALDLPSRFRWLTAKRSTVIQCSEVHPGLSSDPSSTLEKLYAELVS